MDMQVDLNGVRQAPVRGDLAPSRRRVPVERRRVATQTKAGEIQLLRGGDSPFGFPQGADFRFVRRGGPVLDSPTIQPIFVGGEWKQPAPPLAPGAIWDALATIIDGPYLKSLNQYDVTGRPRLLGPMFTLQPFWLFNPPSGDQIQIAVEGLLTGLIDAGKLPEPDENWSQFNVVFLPSTVPFPPEYKGYHSWFTWNDYDLGDVDNDPDRYAVILTSGGMDETTKIFSHELVEAMTDPDGVSGWRQDPDTDPEEGEIGDVCTQYSGRLDGVAVQSYWSNWMHRCVIPTQDHRIRLSQRAVDETSTVGPDMAIDVDQRCSRTHRWTGSYTYHYVNHDFTMTLEAAVTGYKDPRGSWNVAGIEVNVGGGLYTIQPTLSVWRPQPFGSSNDNESVRLDVVATETTLQVSTHSGDANYVLPITYTAIERSDDLAPHISASDTTSNVEVEGQTIWLPDDFVQAETVCLQEQFREQVAGLTTRMKGITQLMAEFNEFVKNHHGPPVNEDLLRMLGQAQSALTREIRLAWNQQASRNFVAGMPTPPQGVRRGLKTRT
jgi:hypothetical protein